MRLSRCSLALAVLLVLVPGCKNLGGPIKGTIWLTKEIEEVDRNLDGAKRDAERYVQEFGEFDNKLGALANQHSDQQALLDKIGEMRNGPLAEIVGILNDVPATAEEVKRSFHDTGDTMQAHQAFSTANNQVIRRRVALEKAVWELEQLHARLYPEHNEERLMVPSFDNFRVRDTD